MDDRIAVFAELYPTEADIRRIVSQACVDAARIDFSGNALAIWQSAFREADASDLYADLLLVARGEYPKHSGLLDLWHTLQAHRGFRPKRRTMPDDDYIDTIVEVRDHGRRIATLEERVRQLSNDIGPLMKHAKLVDGADMRPMPMWIVLAFGIIFVGLSIALVLLLGGGRALGL